MNRCKNRSSIVEIGLILLLLWSGPSAFAQFISELPIIEIRSQEPIIDEVKVDAEWILYYRPHADTQSVLDKPAMRHYIQIEFRGRSSQKFPKKGFGFEFVDNDKKDKRVSLFSFPESSQWVIHSPYSDKSLVRNVLAYDLARDVMSYAPRTQMAEMILNDEYFGVVILTEKIEIGPGRVDISPPSEDINGSVILKFDKGRKSEVIWETSIVKGPTSSIKSNIKAHQPASQDLKRKQIDYFKLKFDQLDDVMTLPMFQDPDLGWRKHIDEESLIDFMLLTELSKDVDAYRISTYLYKEADEDQFIMGPLWDFNLAFGNAFFCEGQDTEGWAYQFYTRCGGSSGSGSANVHFWFPRFLEDTTFRENFKNRWDELRKNILNIENVQSRIDDYNQILSNAQKRNFIKWPILGKYVWPNSFVGDTYEEEIDHLKSWIEDRIKWMDSRIEKNDFTVENPFFHTRVYPNPTSGAITIDLIDQNKEGVVEIEIYGLSGQLCHESGVLNRSEDILSYTWSPPNQGVYIVKIYLDGDIYTTSKFSVIR